MPREGSGGHAEGQRHGPHQGKSMLKCFFLNENITDNVSDSDTGHTIKIKPSGYFFLI